MRLRYVNTRIICPLLLMLPVAGCGDDAYPQLVNPPDIVDPDPDPDPEPGEGTFTVYNYLENAPEVNVSTIWEVTLTSEDAEERCMVFQSTAPTYQAGYRNMIASDQKALELVAGRTISWANFSFEGEVTVTAKIIDAARVPMATPVEIYPSRKGVTPSITGTEITFTLTEPGQYSVEVGTDGYKNGLMIFANPPETDIPNKSGYLVLENATAASVANIPGGYTGVYFEKGVHDIGIFNIPPHIKNVYIPGDAYVFGTLRMINNPNVKIFGRGTLSAAHLDFRASHSVEAIRESGGAGSDYTKVSGIVIADYTHFSVRLISAYNEVDWVKIIGCWTYNSDGISVFANSTVKNCFIWANDDNIKPYDNNVTFEDIVCWQLTNGNVIQLAWNDADPEHVTVKRVDLLHADWNNNEFNRGILGFVGNHYNTAGNNNRLKDHLIEDLITETPVQVVWRVSPEPGHVSTLDGLVMKNWNVKQLNNGYRNYFYSSTPTEPFRGIVFDNVVFNGIRLTEENWISLTNMQVKNIDPPTFR